MAHARGSTPRPCIALHQKGIHLTTESIMTNVMTAAPVQPTSTSCPSFKSDIALTDSTVKELVRLAPGWAWSINTRYINGSIKASMGSRKTGGKTYSYEHQLSPAENHLKAAVSFLRETVTECRSFKLAGIHSEDLGGYVFTFL